MTGHATAGLRAMPVVLGASLLVIGTQAAFLSVAAGAQDSVSPPSFQASASAYGFRVTETIPNGPLASTLIDGGGPTAQAGLDSIGGTSGYASFPDPGAFIAGLPNLGAGLLQLPVAAPQYPLVVNASQTTPKAQIALGIYDIEASAEPTAASANAQAGLSLGVSVALTKSSASIKVQSDGSVMATAEADVQGVGIGPLRIGEIRCVATKKIDAAGKITTTSDTEASALSIGGISVPLPLTTLNALGLGSLTSALPISVNPILEDLLASDGVKIKTLSARSAGNTIVAPAIEIDGVIPKALKLGTGDGSYSVVLGQASATLTGVASPPPVSAAGSGSGTSGGSGTQAGGTASGRTASAGGVLTPIPPAVRPIVVAGASSGSNQPPASTGGTGPPTVAPSAPSLAASLKSLTGAFGISGIYLMVALLAGAAFLVGQLFRVIGVRIAWTSTDG